MRTLKLCALVWLGSSLSAIADDAVPLTDRARLAVERGLQIVQKGARNYPQHRECFSCHHQTLPLLAMDAAREQGLAIDGDLFREQVAFTHTAFSTKLDSLRSGTGIGGKTLTVSYGLWAFDIARTPADEVTAAMVTYLLKNQEPEGHFPRQSLRPPLSESMVTATVLSADFIAKFASAADREAATAAVRRATAWLAAAPLSSQEDFNLRLWGLKLLGGSAEDLRSAREAVLARQRPDGGWSQIPELPSDAYATGQSLFVLRESGLAADSPAYQRGAQFLVDTQQTDGSWRVETRSKPVQVFFDNGDPHGPSQFISITATGWAVTALAPLGAVVATPDE